MNTYLVRTKINRSRKLHCSDCEKKLNIGNEVLFRIYNSKGTKRMKNVYCKKCANNYAVEEYSDSVHPFSEENFD